MIVVENEIVNWKKPQTDTEKFVAERINLLRKNKKRILFERVFPKDSYAPLSRVAASFKLEALYNHVTTGQRERWMISTHELKDKGTGTFHSANVTSPDIDIDVHVEQDPELAFFLSEIMKLGRVGFIQRDHEKEAEEFNKEVEEESTARYIVMKELSDEDIKLRCYAYGVPVKDKSMTTMKATLVKKISELNSSGKDGFSYSKFIKESYENSNGLRMLAYINEAESNNIIELDKTVQRVRYVGSDENILYVAPINFSKWKEKFTHYLLDNDKERERFLACINGTVDDIADISGDFESVNNIMAIKSIARKAPYDIPSAELGGKNVDEIKQMLRDFKKVPQN